MRNTILVPSINAIPIEKLSPTKEILNLIKSALKVRNMDPFNETIGSSVDLTFENWLKKEYPSLVSEKEDLRAAILRRLKNQILKTDLENKEIDFNTQFLNIAILECEANLPTEANMKKNFGLTKKEFSNMVQDMKKGKEGLIERIFLSQFQKSSAIIMSQTGCNKQEAYDCTMDALLEIRKELQAGKVLYGNLSSYFVTKSINQFFRKNKKTKLDLTELTEQHETIDAAISEKEEFNHDLKMLVAKAMEKLGEECRAILKLYYYNEWSFQDIAVELNKGYDAIRKQATRCRDKFKSNLKAKSFNHFKSI